MERTLQRSMVERLLKCGRFRKNFFVLITILAINVVVLMNQSNLIMAVAQDNQQQGSTPMPPTLDGVISPDEYAVTTNVSDTYQVHVTVLGELIYFGIVGKTDGWVAIGIEPDSADNAMKGADIILGWVSNGQTFIVDAYADDPYGHSDDLSLGGTFDIIAWNGNEVDGTTTIEFVRFLNTTDQYDKAIPKDADSLFIIWAIGPSSADNNVDQHDSEDNYRGFATIPIKSGVTVAPPQESTEKVNGGSFLLFHSVVGFLIGIGLYALVYFPTVAIFVKRELQEIVIKRKMREYPRVVEKPRVIEGDSSAK